MTPINLYDCKPNCDMEKAVLKGRATWCCAKCCDVICTNGDQYKPAPAVVLWRTE